jgi:hypothetical protein
MGSIQYKYDVSYTSTVFDALWTQLIEEVRDGFLKLLRSQVIESKEAIPPAYVAWRAGTTTLFLLGS